MMRTVKYPQRQHWNEILRRPSVDYNELKKTVEKILMSVKNEGDEALKRFSLEFDKTEITGFEVSRDEWKKAEPHKNLKEAIDVAIKNITAFHAMQKESMHTVEIMEGIVCWRKSIAIEKAGLYIPGGTAPLFSTLLMLAVPAVMAGCREIIVCTPAGKDGNINSALLYAAEKTGITKVFRVGGAHAIAAMAYGTETIPQVYKIFGPGNQYVTCAKMLLNAEGIAIDLPAGPSEVAVLADNSCIPEFVAADLLSQAEHGIDSQVLLISDEINIIDEIKKCLEIQIAALPRKEIALQALKNSLAILVNDMEEGMLLINEYAPEHLIICCRNENLMADKVINAGSVFLGNYSPESAGDYATGTNHTLPTNGYAKAYSGVSLDSFLKKITFQKLTAKGLKNIAPAVTEMARAEGLHAHANAVDIRLKNNDNERI